MMPRKEKIWTKTKYRKRGKNTTGLLMTDGVKAIEREASSNENNISRHGRSSDNWASSGY